MNDIPKQKHLIQGLSKLSREQIIETLYHRQILSEADRETLSAALHPNDQSFFDHISENTISNYHLPFGIAPNFLINDRVFHVPMVTEESSVVAAAAKAAKFWEQHGGFQCRVINTLKQGQIFFEASLNAGILKSHMIAIKNQLNEAILPVSKGMNKRGGGVMGYEINAVPDMKMTWVLNVSFQTADAMGANFINSCLELMAPTLKSYIDNQLLSQPEDSCHILMAILSNYTPHCLAECKVSAPVQAFEGYANGFSAQSFAEKFVTAVQIAHFDISRAVTHNKGIFNGMDAVVIATGNDFRAIEADGHAYASRNGIYQSLSTAFIKHEWFNYELTVPLALGTVGGLTRLHPLVQIAHKLLGNPSAEELMQIVAATGLANNFSAIASLITTGIQKGHMKLHLNNVLSAMDVNPEERKNAMNHFKKHTVSVADVKRYIHTLRKKEH
jgi:hydroxymethylglutaryl-CoA reductase